MDETSEVGGEAHQHHLRCEATGCDECGELEGRKAGTCGLVIGEGVDGHRMNTDMNGADGSQDCIACNCLESFESLDRSK